ncbi:MAG TPA: hypothetical protein VK034_23620 [Enhygromyxa sp.]|nr:hypothetical protein [Enhygromyxa sp.]
MQRSASGATQVRCAASFALLGLLTLGACARDNIAREGRVTQAQADQYMRDAIRQSSEGVVLEPSQKGLDQIERTRLNEIAQELRRPGAVCFLERAITTMEPGEIDGEQVWVSVPEGQAKFRVRVAVDGTVLSTELLESGFTDKHMETCLTEALTNQRFVESRDSFAYFIDVYYWVSLGFFAEAQTEQFAALLRRQQAEAGLRAKTCLVGRVPPGEYVVTGLNLFDRDGRTVVNRVDRDELPPEVSSCIATAFKQIRIHAEPDAFIRPAAPEVGFEVASDGTVSMADERWLEMVVLEEQAQREMRRAELLGQSGEGETVDSEVADGLVDTADVLDGGDSPSSSPPPPGTSSPTPATQPAVAPTGDPTAPGTKLELSPRGRR